MDFLSNQPSTSQSKNSCEIDFSLHKKQGLALLSEATEIGYGGSRGGGKSHLARVSAIYFCHVIPGLQTYFFRRLHNELIKNHMDGPTGFRVMLAPWVKSGFVEIVKDEIRFKNGPHNSFDGGSRVFLCHCFTGDTLISTSKGPRPIRSLVNRTGYVNIAAGVQAWFWNVRRTRVSAEIVEVLFDDGTKVRCTPDHRFLTPCGPVEAKDLEGKICQTNGLPLSTVNYKSLKGRNTSSPGVISGIAASDYIGPFGNIITEKFQQDARFTTGIMTEPIIKSRISQLCRYLSTESFMLIPQRARLRLLKISRALVTHLHLGTVAQRAWRGIKSSGQRFLKLVKCPKSASIVVGDSWGYDTAGFAAAIANRQITESMGDTTLRDRVQYAELSSPLTNSNRKKHVAKSVAMPYRHKKCVSVVPAGRDDVYCLTVPHYGFFALANGVLVSNCQHEKDVFNWLGPEMHYLILEQAEQFSEFMIRMLRSGNRIPKDLNIPEPYRKLFPRCLYTFNPGGIGHAFFKREFVKARAPMLVERASDAEGGKLRQFVPARVNDNPSIDPVAYTKTLQGLPPKMVKALLEGDFDSVIGAFFPNVERVRHLIVPFQIPAHWPRFMAMDWGACGDGDPFSIGWYTVADGSCPVYSAVTREPMLCQRDALICYRRWNGAGLPKVKVTDIARGILERERGEKILFRVAGGDIVEQRGIGESVFSLFTKEGVHFVKADQRRQNGAAQVEYRFQGESGYPLCFWFEECEQDLETIASLQHDLHNVNEIARGDDHDYDRHRYACMTRPVAKDAPHDEPPDFSQPKKFRVDHIVANIEKAERPRLTTRR